MDPVKVEYTKHNAAVYGTVPHIIQGDYLKLTAADLGGKHINAVFLSPPWGGTGYNLLASYTLDNIYPDFDKIIGKSLEFSKNILLFLPRNTSITDLVNRLLEFPALSDGKDELVIDIE